MAQAKGIVNKEAWRRSTRELQPYGSGSELGQEDTAEQSEGGQMQSGARKVAWDRERGMKRTNQDQNEDEDGEGTEVDEDEQPPTLDDPTPNPDPNPNTNADEFPAVFKSPNLTQPELFHRPHLHPHPQRQQNQAQTGRLTRGLPARNGRTLGKTVSAPVGSLWGGGGDVDMDLDMDGGGEGEDGFDISEWAKEEF